MKPLFSSQSNIAQIIDGKKQASIVLKNIENKLTAIYAKLDINIGLAVIIVGSNPASLLYVKNKAKQAERLGIKSIIKHFSDTVTEKELLLCINELNNNDSINGILVQLPVPQHINVQNIIDSIDYKKDVDGFSTYNVGLLNSWQDSLEPCTPQGIMLLLNHVYDNLLGKKIVVLGRSRIVGRPMTSLLIRAGCSVLSLNSHSIDIKNECKTADILISAVGIPLHIKEDWVKPGACVIDVAIVKIENILYGDVDFDNVKKCCRVFNASSRRSWPYDSCLSDAQYCKSRL